MLRLYTFVLLFLFYTASSFAQLASGGIPYSLNKQLISKDIHKLAPLDVDMLIREDKLTVSKENSMRFGIEIPAVLNLQNAGTWEELENGDRLWQLTIEAEAAKSINLVYDQFYLPQGATLFLYNANKSVRLGAFTEANNKSYGTFSTNLIKGPTTILEYYEPKAVRGKGRLQVSTIIQGYRNALLDYGDSGGCNININCEEGMDWQDQKRSIVLMIIRGKRHCTGALVNNMRQDCTPYMLTADHCFVGANPNKDAQDGLYIFNYESPGCENEDASFEQSISGAQLLSNTKSTDFALLELSVPPPTDFNAFLSGWSAEDISPSKTTCIHHPQGDIKKISINEDPLENYKLFNFGFDTHWEVSEWEKGTTERISSGSPLYDFNKRIVGQLHGGEASCSNAEGFDIFGKLSDSWNNRGAKADEHIRHFLDPDNTGSLKMDGQFCQQTPVEVAFDPAIVGVQNIASFLCETTELKPQLELMNYGRDSLRNVIINIFLEESKIATYDWTGSLGYLETDLIDLPSVNLEEGTHRFRFLIKDEGGNLLGNNEWISEVEIVDNQVFELVLRTDRFGPETLFEIKNDAGERVVWDSNFARSDTFELSYCLAEGCYQFIIHDTGKDGICCGFGEGGFHLSLNDTETFTESKLFITSDTSWFCINKANHELKPAVEIDQTNICIGETITLSNTSSDQNAFVFVKPADSTVLVIDSSKSEIMLQFTTFGIQELDFGLTNGIDSVSITKSIEINTKLEIAIELASLSDSLSTDGSVTIVPQSGTPPYQFDWNHTDLDSASLLDLAAGDYQLTVTDSQGCSTDTSFSIIYTALEENYLELFGFSIQNPALGQLQIVHPFEDNSPTLLNIFSVAGQKMGEFRLDTGLNSFRSTNLTTGIYIAQITRNNKMQVLKFLYLDD